jgi:hypothetical protein
MHAVDAVDDACLVQLRNRRCCGDASYSMVTAYTQIIDDMAIDAINKSNLAPL